MCERHDVQDFFGKPAFLTVSGQLNGETYATALCDVSAPPSLVEADQLMSFPHSAWHTADLYFWTYFPSWKFKHYETFSWILGMSTIHIRFSSCHRIESLFGDIILLTWKYWSLLCGAIRWLSQSLLLLTWKTTWHAPPPISSMLYVRPAEAYQLTIFFSFWILVEKLSLLLYRALNIFTSSTLSKAHSWCLRWDTSWRIAKKTWSFSTSGSKRVSSPVSLYVPTDHFLDVQCRTLITCHVDKVSCVRKPC